MSSEASPRLFHGIDLVDVARLGEIMARTPAFRERVFTAGERAFCDGKAHPAIHFAARFAAKEATVKALGLGLAPVGVDGVLQTIEVEREAGPPRLVLTGKAAERAEALGVYDIALSLTHTDAHAIASVVMMGRPADPERSEA